MKPKDKTMFCPKCKSTDIKKELNILLAAGVPQRWVCNNCGFFGYVFPEKIKLKKKQIKNDRRK